MHRSRDAPLVAFVLAVAGALAVLFARVVAGGRGFAVASVLYLAVTSVALPLVAQQAPKTRLKHLLVQLFLPAHG
jgi:hypothetical protein